MKFTVDWCVFGYQDNTATAQYSQCRDQCSSEVQSALLDRVLQTNSTLQYQYCKTGNGGFSDGVQDCMNCLQHVPNSNTLVNCVYPSIPTCIDICTSFAKSYLSLRPSRPPGGMQAATPNKRQHAHQARLQALPRLQIHPSHRCWD